MSEALDENNSHNDNSDGYTTPLTTTSTSDRVSNMVISTPATWSDTSLQTGASSSVDANSYMTGLASPYFSGNSREALSEQELLHIFSFKITLEEEDLNPFLTTQEFQSKEDAIQKCLAGSNTTNDPHQSTTTHTDTVDLWHLREFALDKGGFLCPDIRKRAWPKLFGVHQQVLGQEHMGLQSYASLSPALAREVKRDTARTIWKVEECLALSQKYRQEQDAQLTATIEQSRQRLSSPSSTLNATNSSASRVKTAKQKTAYFTECSPSKPESAGSAECDTAHEDNPSSPQHPSDRKNSHLALHPQTGFPISGTLAENPRLHATINERQILYNIIQSTRPGIHYSGLQNVVALALMNLESPSLTRLMLERLTSHHLNRQAHDPECLSAGLSRLIHQVDLDLFLALEQDLADVCEVCCGWITTWFAQDILDPALASRLMDLFLVSHPSMPVYVAVAVLTTHKAILSEVTSTDKTMTQVLAALTRSLSASMERTQAHQRLDHIVQKATMFMQQVPPHQLISASSSSLTQPSIFQGGAPEWMSLALAPTDYQLIQETQFIRSQQTIQDNFSLEHNRTQSRNISFGDESVGAPPTTKRVRSPCWFLFAFLLGICFWSTYYQVQLEKDTASYWLMRMKVEESARILLNLLSAMDNTTHEHHFDGIQSAPKNVANSSDETSFRHLEKSHIPAAKETSSRMDVTSNQNHANSHHSVMTQVTKSSEMQIDGVETIGLSRGAQIGPMEVTPKSGIYTMESPERQKVSAVRADRSHHNSDIQGERQTLDMDAGEFFSKPLVLRSWLDAEYFHSIFTDESSQATKQVENSQARLHTSSEVKRARPRSSELEATSALGNEEKTESKDDGTIVHNQPRSKRIVEASSTPHPLVPKMSLVDGDGVQTRNAGNSEEIDSVEDKTQKRPEVTTPVKQTEAAEDFEDALRSDITMVWSKPLALRSLLHPDDARKMFPPSGPSQTEKAKQSGRIKVGSRHRRVHLGHVGAPQPEPESFKSSMKMHESESSKETMQTSMSHNDSYAINGKIFSATPGFPNFFTYDIPFVQTINLERLERRKFKTIQLNPSFLFKHCP